MVLYILFLLLIFLVPFPPAYILYKKLPSEIIVKGPFKGLNINITGAFGGYFLLVLIALGFAYFALTPAKPCYEVWDISGWLKVTSTDPNRDKEFVYVKDAEIGVFPPNLKMGSDGRFEMKVIVEPGHVEGKRDFPALMFSLPGYIGFQLMLNAGDSNIAITEKTKLIKLTQPVVLAELPKETEEPRSLR